ncbi:MAG: cytochrome c biogenesis protein ResB, partial [Blastocatellia bacterium]|nr:cytochrome c biogenesis protein ResB [Blastocatellia bacterium]
MSTKVDSQSQIEEKINSEATKVRERKQETPIDKLLRVLSSVRFGIIILVVLAIFSAIGTFVVQEGTSDFPKFYDSLTPAERSIYKTLGFMDIYHTWYFNLLLLILSLNIILASIDRIPGYWRFFTSPQYTISENGIRYQPWSTALKFPASAFNREFVDKIYAHCRRVMMPRWMQILGPIGDIFAKITLFRIRVTESKDGMLTIFTERGVWNRYAFCVVHVALLMILIGWFVGNKWGQKGVIQFQPGQISENFFALGVDDSVKKFPLPFTIECVDIKQDLIDSSKKDLSPQNTLDWHTTVVFKEKEQLFKGNVHLNEPVDFKGYRFFQASFDQMNSARSVTLLLQSKDGSGQAQEIVLKRNATVEVPGFGTVQWKDFYPDFGMNPQTKQPFSRSGDYNNPAGEFRVLLSDGTPKTALAFSPNFLEAMKNAPFL